MTEGNWSYETLAEAEAFRLADEAADRKRDLQFNHKGWRQSTICSGTVAVDTKSLRRRKTW